MIGLTLLHYEMLQKLGEGGMGVVYKARDTHLDRFVAIKVLPPERVADPERKRRFVQEAKAASALNHPNIITIHDIASEGGRDFIVMEYVPGKTLDQLIGRKGLKLDETLNYSIQIADALAKAHAAGIVHRDLKPANVMVTQDGLVKVLDFGLAKLTEPIGPEAETVTARTAEGAIVGTVAYMSPEQAEGKPVEARSDIFAFGTVLYEMVSGRRAFHRESGISTLAAIVRDEPAPLPEAPADLQRIVSRCLRKSAAERYQSAAELKGALQEVGRAAAVPTIAVLPFANLSADKENEYFSDGLAEEIINALTRVPGLRVTARTSAFAFRGKEQDVREIGARLGVDHILEGSVRRAGSRMRATVQLINAADGCHLWSERYDREVSDVFAVQDEISQSIADKLRVQMGGGPRALKKPTQDLEAYNLYLQGRYHLYRWTPDGFAKGRQYFEQAIARDPEFALAYDSLAELYWYLGFFGVLPPREAFSTGVWAALRALEIEDTLGETHALLGMYRKELDYNWPEVHREMRRALELNPASPVVRLRNALSGLMPLGRVGEAAAEVEHALQSDPLSLFLQWWLALMLYLGRHYHRAIEQVRRMLDLDAGYYLAHFMQAMVCLGMGRDQEALAAARRSAELSGGMPLILGVLGLVCGRTGNTSEARALLDRLEAMARVTYVPPTSFVWIYFGLGDVDNAFLWMERAVEARDPIIMPVKTFPFLDPFRTDPRYRALLRKMNLEP
jgi:serine/threonine-protein kinase